MYILSFLLFNTLSIANPIEGDWVPLYYTEKDMLECHQRFTESPMIISFKEGLMSNKFCNSIDYHYSVQGDKLTLEPANRSQTMIGCFGLMDLIEEVFSKESGFLFKVNGDSLTLWFDDYASLQLVRAEKLDIDVYQDYYKKLGCKWPKDYYSYASEKYNDEPIYNAVERKPVLCNGTAVQDFIQENITTASRLDRRRSSTRFLVHVLVDKSGKAHNIQSQNVKEKVFRDEINRVISIMTPWKPATIDDSEVNYYYPMLFQF